MSKKFEEDLEDDLLPEYDFSTMKVVARGPRRKVPQSMLLESWICGSRATLALVITDIVGSTALNKRLGDRDWFEVHRQHSKKVNELISQGIYDCRKIKDTGDGFLIAFRTAIDAFGFAVELHKETGHPEVKIRVSIHVGAVRIEPNDIRGGAVNFTSRIAQWTKKPWIVLSNTAKDHIVQELGIKPSEVGFLGYQANLKDFGRQKLWLAFDPMIISTSPRRKKQMSSPPQWWLRIREEMEKENKNFSIRKNINL